jgi:hypothetical protein
LEFWICEGCGSANTAAGDRCYRCGSRRYGPGGGRSSRTPYLLGIGLVIVLGFVGFGAVTLLGRMPPAAQAPAATDTSAAIAAGTVSPTGRPTPTASPTASASTSAQPSESASPTPRPTKIGGGQQATNVKVVKSSNWAGYGLLGGEYTDISAEWTQPAVECSGRDESHVSFWVGLDGVTSPTVEQVGTAAHCLSTNSGEAEQYAWIEMYPDIMRRVTVDVHPDDHFRASVHEIGTDLFALRLENLTTGQSYSTSVARSSSFASSAEWIVEATTICNPACAVATLPQFADTTFTALTAATPDGDETLGSGNDLTRFDLRSIKGGNLATVSPLTLGDPRFMVSRVTSK